MADVRLDIEEANGSLPEVCARCGDAAEVSKTKHMSWCPPWVGILILAGLLPYLVVMLILTKRATVQVPLCNRHKGHWLNRNLIVGFSFVLFAVLAVIGFLLAGMMGRRNDDFFGFACLGTVVLVVIWLIILIVAQNTAIRPKEITDTEVVLTGVSDLFVAAVEEADHEGRTRRRRRRSRWEDDEEVDDDAPPRKRRESSDAIKGERRRDDDIDDEDEPRPKKKPSSDEFQK